MLHFGLEIDKLIGKVERWVQFQHYRVFFFEFLISMVKEKYLGITSILLERNATRKIGL